jgi:hypothetical protein
MRKNASLLRLLSSEIKVDPGVQRVDVPALPGGIGEFDRGDRVYLDDDHVTATYLNTMSSIVEQAIDSALGWRQPETPISGQAPWKVPSLSG